MVISGRALLLALPILWASSAAFAQPESPTAQAADEERVAEKPVAEELADEELADVRSEDRRIGGDAHKRYFLIGPRQVDADAERGHSLLIVLPGGDGSADFNPFILRMYKYVLNDRWLVAQVVAPQWNERQGESLVWPTDANRYPGAKFTTEELIESVIDDVRTQTKTAADRIYLLGWSSGGPPCYAMATRKNSPIAGAFIAMSIFVPQQLPSLDNASGKPFYLLQSPDDRVTRFVFAERAEKALKSAGAVAHLERYSGGHGWQGPIWKMVGDGIAWLETNTPAADTEKDAPQDENDPNVAEPPADQSKADDKLPQAAGDLKQLQGTWKVVSAANDGHKSTDKQVAAVDFTWVIRDQRLTMTFAPKRRPQEFGLRIDDTKSPKQIDITPLGERAPTAWLGIYKIEGDTLTICYPDGGRNPAPLGARSTEFESREESINDVLLELKKEPEEKKDKAPKE
jgi:uncharacterized protein (TIGR03067 family)